MQDTTIKGLTNEILCELDFTKRGILISKPITVDSKYDYIIDYNQKLYKIQCKSSSLGKDGTYIHFGTMTKNIRSGKNNYYSKEDIDFFYTSYNGQGYLVPVERAGKGDTRLRFSSLTQNPIIKWASDYELDKQLSLL